MVADYDNSIIFVKLKSKAINRININTKTIMKVRNLLFGLFASAAVFAACEKEEQALGTPDISISENEMHFDIAGGEKTLTITASRDWKVVADVDWLRVSPESGKASSKPQTVTISAFANDAEGALNRSYSLKFTINDIKSKYLDVSQDGPGGSADALVAYSNDFDITKAQNNSGWPYLDSNYDLWDNKKGTGSETVTYEFGGKMSVRTSGKLSNDGAGYSHYDGSGMNKIFFGAATSIFKIQNITLDPSRVNYVLSFGGQRYIQDDASNIFSFDEFKVYLSNDAQKWTPVTMSFPEDSDLDGDWNLASAAVTLPAGTESLSIAFVCTKSSAYSIDDVLLEVGTEAGQTIDFTAGEEIGGTTGGGNTGGNEGGEDTPSPEDAIFYESFKSSIGDFILEEKTVPSAVNAVWEHSAQYECMKATAYVNPANYASESWLISPEIDLSGQTAAYLTFEHAGGYFGTPSNEATLWISKNGGEWAQLTIAAADYPTSWSFISAGHWDLSSYLGSKVKIAFKYSSTDTKAGTWEVRNVAVIAGTYQAAPEPETPDMPEGTTLTLTTNLSSMTWSSDTHDTYGSGFAASADGVKVAYYKHRSTSVPVEAKDDHIRVYKNSALVLTLENGSNFKYVKFETTGGDYCNTYTVASGNVAVSGKDVIWSGYHASPFVAEMTQSQLRIKSITIVY